MFKTVSWLRHATLLLLLLSLTIYSCSKDEQTLINTDPEIALDETDDVDVNSDTNSEETPIEEEPVPEEEEEEEVPNTEEISCTNPSDFIFNEKDGLVLVEFENTAFSADWNLKNDGTSHSGGGYLVWEGPQYFNSPSIGTITYKIKIENPGSYRFLWHTAIKTGTNGTEHNDTWLRFNDADDFYGLNGQGSTVYPQGSGKGPNPEGSSSDGWFKIYRSGNNVDFKWEALTSDNSGYDVYVKFDNPGVYLMEVSARSSGHAIDKFVLFKDSISVAAATSSMEYSLVSCD